MELKIIDFQNLLRDLGKGFQRNFNSSFHTAGEAPYLPIPTNEPYNYEIWLPLILKSRGISPSALQVVSLSRAQIKVLVDAAGASIHTRRLNRSYAEDLQDEVYPAFQRLVFPREGLFMRLGACSPKDGAQTNPGQLSIHSVEDIVLRVTTSMRTRSALSNMLSSDSQEGHVYFLPFDTRMRSEREYRVFCVPKTLGISAVSQYRWHKPWILAHENRDEMTNVAQKILNGIQGIRAEIIAYLQTYDDRELESLVRSQGLTFDVLYDENAGQCMLIELNPFGGRSACGSCLFHWMKDRVVLYGGSRDVEFRVTA
ncbi:hypothetical protein Trco_006072 [Trichoderma cornu-damae]|uniref:Cell division cycle protein 123 n=1 Tax=Trichoderma cornu-damae TaxID=654480 RepID=A0A9P8TVT9_9HYPO|nr:hypothetical protein Trco_006072 [Trichoderma cornu-damae]